MNKTFNIFGLCIAVSNKHPKIYFFRIFETDVKKLFLPKSVILKVDKIHKIS